MYVSFLSMSARTCEKDLISFVMSVHLLNRLPACLHVSARLALDTFHEILYWRLVLKSVKKVQIWLQSDENIGNFTSDQSAVYCCWQYKIATEVLSLSEMAPGC
jgi:hypothetical protein